jgi:hypothetical protein
MIIQNCGSRKYSFSLILFLTTYSFAYTQSVFSSKEALFTTPRQYTAKFSSISPVVDGKINDPVWQNLPWTENFKDIEGDSKPLPTWNTRAKMTWTSQGLYIAAELLEPHVWAYLTNHDDVVFYDNDFEVFIDPDNDTHRYYEIEINAVNTIFDLFMPKPYRNNSGAMFAYNTPGMKTAVSIQGTLNNPNDKDKGWTVEMFIPFMAVTMGNVAKVPSDGEFWRINFSRVEWDVEVKEGKYVKLKGANGRNLPEHNWVWSPQGVINMHYPERWGYLFFSKPEAGKAPVEYKIPYSETQKKHLWLVYYLQKEYFQKNRTYAKELKELGIAETAFDLDGENNKLWMEATNRQFMVYISSDDITYSVNDEGLVQTNRTSR